MPESSGIAAIVVFIDGETVPLGTYEPPATWTLDTTRLSDGAHVLHLRATDSLGTIGIRSIPFIVQNGPGITITGLRSNERVSGKIAVSVNAFNGDEPFDPVRAESSGPVPVWTWVMAVLVAAWAGWYGLTEFRPPPTFADLRTRDARATGFDFAELGERAYALRCAACHGVAGAGVPGAFPPLAHDAVVGAADPRAHVRIVLHGLSRARIGGASYAGAMPAFGSLDDATVAAIIDHERTSWGNRAPLVTPDDVRRAR